MDLKQLRYFCGVIDEKGVHKAAKLLHVSQPAVTVAIKNLEADLDLKLFEREGRKLHPTAEGFHFYRHARLLLAQAETAKADMAAMKSLKKAEIKIAAPVTIASYILAEPIGSFLDTYPGVKLSFSQMGGPMVESALLNGDIDIGVLGRFPSSAEIEQHALVRQQLSGFVRPGHTLAAKGFVTWPDLLAHKIVTLPKSYFIYGLIADRAAHYRMSADIILESDIVQLQASTIRKGDAVGLSLETVADQETGLVSLPLLDETGTYPAEGASMEISACHLKGVPLSLAAQALVSHLQKAL